MVDGFDRKNKTLYEFHGCYHHGCETCFKDNDLNVHRQQTLKEVRKISKKRIDKIQAFCVDNNMKLIEIKECEYNKLVKNEKMLKEMIEKNLVYGDLKPRDTLYGGRTNAFMLYYKCKINEKIKYVDFYSLYPDIMKNGIFPVGHPESITENFKDFDHYFGLVKCRILPPQDLYAPVLPARINKKLVFALCTTCAKKRTINCNHNEKERAINGTWCTLEVKKAIEKGYKMLDIFEIWHWNKSEQYDKIMKSGGLFTEYINNALILKLHASGFPPNVNSEIEKDEYIKRVFEREGVLLIKEKIIKNPGQRAVAKLMLNSLWGYLAMNQDKVEYKVISQRAQWFSMVSDPKFKIKNLDFSIPTCLQVHYSQQDSRINTFKTNVVIATFVTAQARLKLYNEIEKLGKRVLYFDTDSIIYVSTDNLNEYDPTIGEYLGDLTNKIDESDGNFIVEFVSAGPKNYAYKTETDKGVTKCTIKGFTLND